MTKGLSAVSLLVFFALATLYYIAFDQPDLKAQENAAIAVNTSSPNQQYEIFQLPSQYATNYGAKSINDKGEIVATYWIPPNPAIAHAMLWQKGVLFDLGTLGGGVSVALDINNNTEVVGSSETSSNTTHAFRWSNGVMTDLGTLGSANSSALAINKRGQIVGSLSFPSPLNVLHAVLWDNGTIIDLGTGPFASAGARDINDKGQIVGLGSLPPPSSDYHAFLWEGGVMTDLGTLGGNISVAFGINISGQVVGASETPAGNIHAFLWEHGTMRDQGVIGGCQSSPGCSGSEAFDINDSGEIVGSTTIDATGRVHAFLWKNGVFTDLGTPFPNGGPTTSYGTTAYGINKKGQVVGVAHGVVDIPLLWTRH